MVVRWPCRLAIATRSIALLRRVGIEDQVTFTGGVTRNQGMVHVLSGGTSVGIGLVLTQSGKVGRRATP